MSEELHKLQRVGAQKIYEQTHIPIQHIQEILQSDFSSFSRVQFLGFVSILEREYNEDLSSLKAFGMSYFDEQEEKKSITLSVAVEEKSTKKPIYLGVAFILFILVVIIQYTLSLDGTQKKELDDTLIENIERNITTPLTLTVENNLSNEMNTTEEEIKIPLEETVKSFKIVTKSKVWIGYIEIQTNLKKQKVFKGELNLDPNKEWLLVFGHGYIDMYVDGQVIPFSSREKIRFIYKNGELKSISLRTFKKLNRGRSW